MNLRRTLTSDSSLKLGRVALVGLAFALSAVACSIGTSDDNEPGNGTPNDTGGQGGDTGTGGGDTGGSDTGGGTSTGGQGGDPGTGGGTAALDCADAPTGTEASAEITVDDEVGSCAYCLKQKCAEDYSACFSTDPDYACGGDADGNGAEINCVLDCMVELGDEFVGGEDNLDACTAQCKSESCDANSEVTPVTRDLALCILGETDTGCQFECGFKCVSIGENSDNCLQHEEEGACTAATDCAWNAPQ